jgi:ATP-dependent RNA helicase DHX37/DHR1
VCFVDGRYDPNKDKLVCFVIPYYGPNKWELPIFEMEYPAGVEKYKWFARLFLEGAICAKMVQFQVSS